MSYLLILFNASGIADDLGVWHYLETCTVAYGTSHCTSFSLIYVIPDMSVVLAARTIAALWYTHHCTYLSTWRMLRPPHSTEMSILTLCSGLYKVA